VDNAADDAGETRERAIPATHPRIFLARIVKADIVFTAHGAHQRLIETRCSRPPRSRNVMARPFSLRRDTCYAFCRILRQLSASNLSIISQQGTVFQLQAIWYFNDRQKTVLGRLSDWHTTTHRPL